MGLFQSAGGLKRKKADVPEKEGILPVDGLQTRAASTLSWVSSLQSVSPPCRFLTFQPPQSRDPIPIYLIGSAALEDPN